VPTGIPPVIGTWMQQRVGGALDAPQHTMAGLQQVVVPAGQQAMIAGAAPDGGLGGQQTLGEGAGRAPQHDVEEPDTGGQQVAAEEAPDACSGMQQEMFAVAVPEPATLHGARATPPPSPPEPPPVAPGAPEGEPDPELPHAPRPPPA
jgi:hypothetical protein